MTACEVRTAVVEKLASHGYDLPGQDVDLISVGVHSAALIQILSALEEEFDVDLDIERLFSEPLTVTRIEAEITRAAALP